ncbi:hypothetical protein F2D81_25810 [Salmonella enterica]|nr:hypothetical protein [Salmonella enterica]EEA0372579.1 hypothetical protein [Salmonella enterica]
MKKLILASAILLAANAAHATVGGFSTDGVASTPVAGENTVQLFLSNTATSKQEPIKVTYGASNNNIVNGHTKGAIAQYATIIVPAGTVSAKLSGITKAGVNESRAAVSIINNLSNSDSHTDKLFATMSPGDTLYVGLVATDSAAWSPGETTANATLTFYSA